MNDVPTGGGIDPTGIVRRGIVPAWNAGLVDNITWIRVRGPGGYEFMRAAESFSVQGIRLPASFDDEIAMCIGNAILPVTPEMQDASLAAAPFTEGPPPKGIAITEDGPPPGAGEIFNDPGQVLRFNETMGPVGKELREGECKRWVVRGDLLPGQVINRGDRRRDGTLIQQGRSVSIHNAKYKGYSQQFAPSAVRGFLNGKPVNILDHLAKGCALGMFPPWLVAKLRGAVV